MKKILLSAIAFAALLAGPATAADLPVYKASPELLKAPPREIFSGWNGYYLGLNIGYSWGEDQIDWSLAGFPATSDTGRMNGVIGGFQSGINLQIGNWVYGMEIDGQWSGQKGTTTNCLVTCAIASVEGTRELDWLGTARSRIGLSPSPFTYLIYLTGGVAYGQVRAAYNLSTPAGVVANFGYNNGRLGWTAGAGIEVAVIGDLSVKLEYLYVDLGKSFAVANIAAVDTATPVVNFNSRVTDNIVRIGANYAFPRRP
jgi:outer membrane immunogenic protein